MKRRITMVVLVLALVFCFGAVSASADNEIIIEETTFHIWSDGSLYIKYMRDYEAGEAPWLKYADQITSVSTGDDFYGTHCCDGLYNLKEIQIDSDIEQIRDYAFANCGTPEYISFSYTVPQIASNAFKNTTSIVYYNGTPDWDGVGEKNYGGKLTWRKIYESDEEGPCGENVRWHHENAVVTFSGKGEFYDYPRYSYAPYSYYIGNALTLIFQDGITNVPDNLCMSGFSCGGLRLMVVRLADSITNIGEYAFVNFNMSTIDLPDNLKTIESHAFDCADLRTITIPATVEYIGDQAFNFNNYLTEIWFQGDAPAYIGADAFGSDEATAVTATVYYPKGNKTWNKYIGKDFGGDLTWVAYDICKAPTVKATNIYNSGNVKLSWNKVANAVSYKIYRAVSPDDNYYCQKTITGTSWIDTYGEAGSKYYYKVYAVNADGTMSPAGAVSRTKDLARPVVKASNVLSSGKVKLTWNKVEGAKSYTIYRATSKNGTYYKMKTVTSTSYVNLTAKAGKLYFYKVVANAANSNANSAKSLAVQRTGDLARPVVFIKLNANGKPRLSWAKVDGAVSYKIYRATSKNGKYDLMKTVTGTAYTNTSAKKGVTYYYKVVAVCSNTNGNSAYSTVVSIKP